MKVKRKERDQRPGVKEKNNELRRRDNLSPEEQERQRARDRSRYQIPEVKLRVQARSRAQYQRPEVKARKKELQEIREKLPEVRAKIREKVNQRRKTDIQFKLSHDARARRWEVLKRAKADKPCGFEESLGCTLEQWEIHLQGNMPIHSQTKQIATWDDFLASPTRLHIDEIIPCDAWDLTDPVQYKLCFHYSNSRLLWAFDNMSRGGYDRNPEYYDKLMAEKLAEYYRLNPRD